MMSFPHRGQYKYFGIWVNLETDPPMLIDNIVNKFLSVNTLRPDKVDWDSFNLIGCDSPALIRLQFKTKYHFCDKK